MPSRMPSPVCPVPQCPYVPSDLCQAFYVAANIFYMNIVTSSLLIALRCAEFACERNQSTLNLITPPVYARVDLFAHKTVTVNWINVSK